jgi:ectoine hydroxylase-related dioxygenase (phytanoyl-CoA dioxygenase family)
MASATRLELLMAGHQDIADYGGSGDTDGATTEYTYHGMTNFANLCAITYLSDCSPDCGATSVIPRSHRRPDGGEAVRRPLFTSTATQVTSTAI